MAHPNVWKADTDSPRRSGGQQPGNLGRRPCRSACRGDRLSAAFLTALADTFEEANGEGGSKGLDALKKVRDEDPATFARIYATLLPKQLEIEDTPPESALTDEQLEQVYQALLADRPAAGVNDKDQLGPQTVN